MRGALCVFLTLESILGSPNVLPFLKKFECEFGTCVIQVRMKDLFNKRKSTKSFRLTSK
jgi:hypothetical protein